MTPPRTPVIVGYGQVNQHDEDPAVEPIDSDGGRGAASAADPRVLEAVDSIRVVNILSWRYRDPGRLLAQRVRARDASTRYTGVGGNVPQTLVNQACLDIQAGRAELVVIAGAETFRTRTRMRNRGSQAGLDEQDESVPFADGANEGEPLVGPAETRHRPDPPAYFYPMFEQALRIDAGESPETTAAASANCGRDSARSLRANPHAWSQESVVGRADLAAERRQPDDQLALHEADELQQHGRSGRGRHPGLGGEGHAPPDPHRALGFPLRGHRRARHVRDRSNGRSSTDPGDQDRGPATHSNWPGRHRRHRPGRPLLVLPVGGAGGRRRTRACRSAIARPLTVTGGLTFAGGPWNNYVTHSIATMAETAGRQPRAARPDHGQRRLPHQAQLRRVRRPSRPARIPLGGRPSRRRPRTDRTAEVDWSGRGHVEPGPRRSTGRVGRESVPGGAHPGRRPRARGDHRRRAKPMRWSARTSRGPRCRCTPTAPRTSSRRRRPLGATARRGVLRCTGAGNRRR